MPSTITGGTGTLCKPVLAIELVMNSRQNGHAVWTALTRQKPCTSSLVKGSPFPSVYVIM